MALMQQISTSELVGLPGQTVQQIPTVDQLESLENLALAAADAHMSSAVRFAFDDYMEANATYERDQWYGQYPSSATPAPVLLLNGDLDLNTPLPLALHAMNRLNNSRVGGEQRIIVTPFSSHCTIVGSPLKSSPSYTCGQQMISSFLLNGLHGVDTSCLNDVITNDWQAAYPATIAAVRMLFNTSSMWDE